MIHLGKLDPSVIITRTMPLENAPRAYQRQAGHVVKVVFKPAEIPVSKIIGSVLNGEYITKIFVESHE
jgi:hypothetical protein